MDHGDKEKKDALSASLKFVNSLNLPKLEEAIPKTAWADLIRPTPDLEQFIRPQNAITELSQPIAQAMRDLQSSPAMEAIARIHKDLERFREPILSLHAKWVCGLEQVIAPYRDFHEQIAKSIEQFRNFQLDLGLKLKPVFETLPGMLEGADRFARHLGREWKAAKTIEELGFVPHEALWDCFIDRDLDASTDRYEVALGLIKEIWPVLRPELTLGIEECLGDAKLFSQYSDAIDAYERGRDEACVAVGVAVIERAIELAREETETKKVPTWLRNTVGGLPASVLGGYRAFLTWRFLIDKVYRDYASDEKANQGHYPKRNAVYHGLGSRVSGPLDSFNTVLLAHFVIQLCNAVKEFRLSVINEPTTH